MSQVEKQTTSEAGSGRCPHTFSPCSRDCLSACLSGLEAMEVSVTCNTCGEDSTEFREGHCLGCFTDRQNALDLHNAQFDRWERMTDKQRGAEIRKAAQHG